MEMNIRFTTKTDGSQTHIVTLAHQEQGTDKPIIEEFVGDKWEEVIQFLNNVVETIKKNSEQPKDQPPEPEKKIEQ